MFPLFANGLSTADDMAAAPSDPGWTDCAGCDLSGDFRGVNMTDADVALARSRSANMLKVNVWGANGIDDSYGLDIRACE